MGLCNKQAGHCGGWKSWLTGTEAVVAWGARSVGLPSHILKDYFQEKKWKHLKSHKSIKWCNKEAALLWHREVTSNDGWKLCRCGKGRLSLVTKF